MKTYTCTVCGNKKTEVLEKLVPTGTTVQFINYTSETADPATVTVDGKDIPHQKGIAVEGILGADGVITVSCARACIVAYTTDSVYSKDSNFKEVLAVANDDGTYSFIIDEPVQGMTIAIVHRGDADLNGTVNVNDAARVQRYAASMTTNNAKITNLGKITADVDGRNGINVNDAARIQRNAALMTSNNAKISWHTA